LARDDPATETESISRVYTKNKELQELKIKLLLKVSFNINQIPAKII